jgi:N-acetylneuraminic acid mutarotase
MNPNRFLLLFIFIFQALFYNCEKLDLKREAIVETSCDLEFSLNEAKISGRIIDAGENLLEYGHCWGTEPHPTIKDNRTINTDDDKNEWESIMEGIRPHVRYYVRAYSLDKDLTETYSKDEPEFIIEDVWIQLEPFPGEPRQQAFGFSIGSKGYFGGGRRWHEGNFILFKDFWEYNTENGVWTRLEADFPYESAFHSAFVINDKGYVYQNLTNELFEYDPSVNQWFPKEPIPIDETKIMPIAMTINNKGYIIGGSNTNTVWVYDPELNKWEESDNRIPWDVGVYAGIGFNIGNRYFLGGGHSRGNMEEEPVKLTDFYEYDPNTEGWPDRAGVNMFESYYLSYFSLGNWGYVLDYDMLWAYNPNEDEWCGVSDFPHFAKRLFPTIVSINNLGYLFAGGNNPEEDLYLWYYTEGYNYSGWEYYNDLWVYVPPADF